MHTLNTASYVCINKAMQNVDKVRQRIFSVNRMNSQANSELAFAAVIRGWCECGLLWGVEPHSIPNGEQ